MTANNLPQELTVVLVNLLREYDRMKEKFGDGFTYGAIGSAVGDVLKYFEHLPMGNLSNIPLTEKTTTDGILHMIKHQYDLDSLGSFLFRGRTRSGEWLESGNISQMDGKVFISPPDGYNSPDHYEVEPHTLGQYVCQDRNNKRAWSGDIVQGYANGEPYGYPKVIKFLGHGFYMVGADNIPNPDSVWIYDFEVIGNIHDSP